MCTVSRKETPLYPAKQRLGPSSDPPCKHKMSHLLHFDQFFVGMRYHPEINTRPIKKKKKKVAQERTVKPLPEYMSRCWFLESVRIPVSAAAEDSFSFCFTLILHWESTTTTNYHTPTPKYRMHLNFLKLHPYFCHLSCPRVFSLCLIPSNQ